jgi:hypothetical protein
MTPPLALSVPSGSHYRSLLLPLRRFFLEQTKVQTALIVPPGAEKCFPASLFPSRRFLPLPLPRAAAWLKKAKPSLLITTTTGLDRQDIFLLRAARRHSVRTLTFIESWDNIWKMERNRKAQIMADYLCVWNENMRRHLMRAFGVPGRRIWVVGAPRFDIYARPPTVTRAALASLVGLDPRARWLHFATVELYPCGFLAAIVSRARRKGLLPASLNLLATVHPGGSLSRHRAWAQRHGFVLRYAFGRHTQAPHPHFVFQPTPRETELAAALYREADILLTFTSTAALEASLAGRPSVCVKFGRRLDWWRWKTSAIYRDWQEHFPLLAQGDDIHAVSGRRQLIRTIQKLLLLPPPKVLSPGWRHPLGVPPGGASASLWKVIVRLQQS